MAAGQAGVRIEVDKRSLQRLDKALRILGEDRATWIRDAWDDVGAHFAAAVRRRAPGSMRPTVEYRGLGRSGTLGGIKASGRVKHPGARSMEFGRGFYWTGYRVVGRGTRRRFEGGRRVRRTGQRARPFLGVMSDPGNPQHATGDVTPYARERLARAASEMWEHIGRAG
jgi:hypothetical protein